jgi:hypothetical protein
VKRPIKTLKKEIAEGRFRDSHQPIGSDFDKSASAGTKGVTIYPKF